MSASLVAGITVYPVKSTAGSDVECAVVEPRGLRDDRRLMLVDDSGVFITGREHPLLTRVRARVGDGVLHLEAPGADVLEVALAPGSARGEPVEIWRQRCTGVALDARADRWFSDRLGTPCRLVQMTDPCSRPTDPDHSRPGDEVSFADGFPLLLTSTASLADLNARLAAPMSMRRFRPNLVVDGVKAFAEDGWTRLAIGEVEFDCVKRCARCVFTTIDPETGLRDANGEPLRTLTTYRRGTAGVLFGQNLTPRSGGVVRVGDPVEVIE